MSETPQDRTEAEGALDSPVVERLHYIRQLVSSRLSLSNSYSEAKVKGAMAAAAGVGSRTIELYLTDKWPVEDRSALTRLEAWARTQFEGAYPPTGETSTLPELADACVASRRAGAGAGAGDLGSADEPGDAEVADTSGHASVGSPMSGDGRGEGGRKTPTERSQTGDRSRWAWLAAPLVAAVVGGCVMLARAGIGEESRTSPGPAVTTSTPSATVATSLATNSLPTPASAVLTFDGLGSSQDPYVRVYPGVGDSDTDRTENATFDVGATQRALCWTTGRRVTSSPDSGEELKSSRVWIEIEAPADQRRFATLVYGRLNINYRHLPRCESL